MHIESFLDVDLVALQSEDCVTCLVELQAPELAGAGEVRPGQTLVVVLDRSGSMGGAPLDGAKAALESIVPRLAPQDAFGVVVFDNNAQVVVPVKLMADHDVPGIITMIRGIETGGSTDISAGALLALRESKRVTTTSGSTIVVISDGHANAGIVDPTQMSAIAATARADGITTSTIGFGLGYDEALLSAIATGGQGSHLFAETVDEAIAAVAEQVDGLLSKSVQNLAIRIKPIDESLAHCSEGLIQMGDLYSGEKRKALVRFVIPGIEGLGLHHIADITVEYLQLPELHEHTVTLPISVNVVPGDEASGRVPNPYVVVQALIADSAKAKSEAVQRLRSGDSEEAQRILGDAEDALCAIAFSEPRIDDEIAELKYLKDSIVARDVNFAAKEATRSMSNQMRGKDTEGFRRKNL